MKVTVRFLLAFVLALFLEAGFIYIVKNLHKPHKQEVKQVIKISLLKNEQKPKVFVTKQKKIVKEPKQKKKVVIPKEKPKVVTKKPQKKIPQEEKKEVLEKKKPGGLKPLQGNLPAYYVDAIKKAIEENIFYPLEAIERGEEGVVSVKFVLDKSGKVIKCKPFSGKSEILQKATCIAIERAKFPPIPKTIKNEKITFQLEIEYNLESLKQN
ncbi:energy transducer TonB [Desulfurobacterium thermolithotrophum]|uniref:energy transducer TonB n=1 Tax=Desulfurobacterium thermolithotrophum TaxID=64160 RepID=UPI0013D14A8C|nr:energy transducer TonB [Desulfurobacterium thermolithotrophum]